ncbi:hypothetical protein DN069_04450 [Streptacidiphilus pinicola]|uniref:Uncharacterized protein n=1 Tax=Streptacidiphilus pinicola TaxID=2219663 RepID=A0A2X0KCI8_9ACTN|nr:hypothetical protein [Streptacidiphilus pinicola]RAG86795.1 hypothetical protein DN069_04450 [Streptacidiphilus pinicola]
MFTGTARNPGTQMAAGTATFTATPPAGQDISRQIALPQGMYVAFEDDWAGRKTKGVQWGPGRRTPLTAADGYCPLGWSLNQVRNGGATVPTPVTSS